MLNGGWNLSRTQVKEMREYHKKQLANGWRGIKDGNIRTRYRIIKDDGNDISIEVESFYTTVCYISKESGLWWILKEWDGYSSTTLRHLNLLAEKFHFPSISKKKWNDLAYQSWCILSSE